MNDSAYKVSIITVSYNSVKTIEQTIQSVLKQTYKNIEYIIIDGASTDGTQQIIKKYADKISYYISEKDDGLYYAMNKGIQKATGDFVGIINSDDWYAETAVENAVTCFEQSDAEVVYGVTISVEGNGTRWKRKRYPLETMWHQMPFVHPSVFVKKDVYCRCGEFNTNYKVASDYDFFLRCYSENVRFAYCEKVVAYFRTGGTSSIFSEVSRKESYKVSMSYIDKCPYKTDALFKIKELYDWRYFNEKLTKDSKMLYRLLCEYFQKDIANIFIFGTGIWGKKYYKQLVESGINITGFADNDRSKWNTEFCGLTVIHPNELRRLEAHVLIAVKDHGEEIRAQLRSMENDRLKYVMITELMELIREDN